MLRPLILNRVAAHERRSGVSLAYLRFIVNASVRAFLRFTKVISFATYRRRLPVEAHFAAALAATLEEDCGPCVQFVVNEALTAGVEPRVLEVILKGEGETLGPDHAAVITLARGAAGAETDLTAAREHVRGRYGDAGLVEVAYASAGSRVFPSVKRVLGFAERCDVAAIRTTRSRSPSSSPTGSSG